MSDTVHKPTTDHCTTVHQVYKFVLRSCVPFITLYILSKVTNIRYKRLKEEDFLWVCGVGTCTHHSTTVHRVIESSKGQNINQKICVLFIAIHIP